MFFFVRGSVLFWVSLLFHGPVRGVGAVDFVFYDAVVVVVVVVVLFWEVLLFHRPFFFFSSPPQKKERK